MQLPSTRHSAACTHPWSACIALLAAIACTPRPPLVHSAAARSPASTASGEVPAAAAAPSEEGAIYFVLVDRFANGDPTNDGAVDLADPQAFHGGDLQGVLSHLDDLHALGVRTLWLSPVTRMRTEKYHGYGAFHGYWVEDPNAIEPRFGSMELLRRLSDELHRRGMHLYLDVVLNHVAFDSPLLRDHPDWFHHAGALTDWNDPEQLLTHDVQGLPDLAQEREDVYRFLTDASLRWIREIHPDGFRLDAVKHVPASFWQRYGREIHAAAGPGFRLLGEYLDGNPASIAAAQRSGGFDSMFDFPFGFATVDVFCKDQSLAKLGTIFAADRHYPDPDSLVTLLDDHDLPRLATQCRGDSSRMEQALRFLLTARGTPAITYGTEVGLAGAKEPENRGDMRFDSSNPLNGLIAGELELRRKHPSLQHGAPLVVDVQSDLFAYARVEPDEAALIAVNRAKTLLTTRWPEGLSGEAVSVGPQSVQVIFSSPGARGGFRAIADQARKQWLTGGRKRPVEFELTEAPENAGIFIVGSGPELGAWNASAGLGPVRHGEVTTCLLPAGDVFEYKLVSRKAGGAIDWEPGGNRTLFVQDGPGPIRLRVAWRRSG
jgi:glycosidase